MAADAPSRRRPVRRSGLVARFGACRRGVSAVEFALMLPVMLLLLLGGYTYSQILAVNRKLTITTRAVADLTTHYSTLTSSQLSTIIATSSQVFSPFSTATLSVRVSEIYISAAGIGTVVWSQANANTTALATGQIVVLPSGMGQANSYVVWAQLGYSYTPIISYALTGSISLADQLIMVPRRSGSISLTS